jgi:hypothetical protein
MLHSSSVSCNLSVATTLQAVRLLAEFCRTAPEDYDAQYATNQVSVRLAGDLVACLAELQPKVASNCISQLRPYLGCAKAYCLRGSLLAAVGSILVQVRAFVFGLLFIVRYPCVHSPVVHFAYCCGRLNEKD